MKIPLYDRIALRRDLPDLKLRAGDVATLVDYVPHPAAGEEGCVLEILNALGGSIGTAVVKISDIEPLRADEILAVRPLAQAG